MSTQPWCWGRQGCSHLQRQADTSESPAVPGGEDWGHRQCVLACLGAFAKGREGLPQESWAGVLEALPSCQCSPQSQSLGSPPCAELQLRQELSRSSRAPCSDPRIKCVKLTVQIHSLERSSRLWENSMGWYSCTRLGSRQRSPQGSPQGRGHPCPSVQEEWRAQTAALPLRLGSPGQCLSQGILNNSLWKANAPF